jgi:hypothetical protein
LIKINIEQFSHAGATPFGYTELGKDLGHTGDSQMAQDIYDGTLEHDALSDGAIYAFLHSYGNTQPLKILSNQSCRLKTSDQLSNMCLRKQHHPSWEEEYITTKHARKGQTTAWLAFK